MITILQIPALEGGSSSDNRNKFHDKHLKLVYTILGVLSKTPALLRKCELDLF